MKPFLVAAAVVAQALVTLYAGNAILLGSRVATVPAANVVGNKAAGSTAQTGDAGYMDASRFMSGQQGALASISAYVGPVGAAPSNQFQLALYSDAGGKPGSLIASTATGTLHANAWNTMPVKASVVAGAPYWLAYNANGSSPAMNNLTSTKGGVSARRGPVKFGSWPSTFGPAKTQPVTFAIFATYVPPPPPPPQPSPTNHPTPSPSGSLHPTASPTPHATPTATPTAHPTPTPTQAPSPTPTPTLAPPPPPPPPTATGHVGGYWLYGANMPWLNWNSDFGGSGGGVHQNVATVDAKLAAAQGAGMHYVRWWVFEGGSPQITRDGSGTPTGINPAVYTDMDAALAEAAKYDIFYDFVLFGSTDDDAVTHQWWEDATKRAALVNVLAPLFAHYSGNPRIATWEIVNEPEWQSRNAITSVTGMLATVDALANAVHSNSHAYVTVGNAQIQDMATWVGHPLDYYSPHYYDNFGTGSNDPFTTRVASPDGKPVVIGEFPAGPGYSPSAQARYQAAYANGYAGAWAWSLTPEDTSDKISIDLAGAAAFAGVKTDLGPR